jgi:hypothetical protein
LQQYSCPKLVGNSLGQLQRQSMRLKNLGTPDEGEAFGASVDVSAAMRLGLENA